MNKRNLYVSTMDEHAHILARQYGLGLELAEFCTAWNLDEQFPQTDAVIRKKMRCSDRFTIHGPFNELFPCAIDPRARDLAAFRFRQTIQTACCYGISKIILHGGYNSKMYFPCWYTEQSILFWKKFMDKMPDQTVICLENVLEETPEMLADIIREVNCPRLRMCLDVGHVQAYSGIPPIEWVNRCADVIDHFHVHNNDGTWDTHSGLTEGKIPMEELLHAIEKQCAHATVTLELMDAEPSIQWLKNNDFLEVL